MIQKISALDKPMRQNRCSVFESYQMISKKRLFACVAIAVILAGSIFVYIRFVPRTLIVPDKYETIHKAVAKAKAGDTVFVKNGLHLQKRAIEFKNGVKLIGENRDQTIIQLKDKPRHVINVTRCKSGLISNLTFKQDKQIPFKKDSAYVLISNSSIEIYNCRITEVVTGSNIRISGKSKPLIHNCIIESSAKHGIYVYSEGTYPTIRENLIRYNERSGIFFRNAAAGLVESNTIMQNKHHGIQVENDGHVRVDSDGNVLENTVKTSTLINNHVLSNRKDGIHIYRRAKALVENNICRYNQESGIIVSHSQTTATLKNNRCTENKDFGICFWNKGKGLAQKNICNGNGGSGIYVTGRWTEVDLISNRCRQNGKRGIYVCDNARACIKKNICEENISSGIEVHNSKETIEIEGNWCRRNTDMGVFVDGPAKAEIRNNICNDNDWQGILFEDGAKCLAQSNICEDNRSQGICVANNDTEVTLVNNRCFRNNYSGIMFVKGSGGEATGNICKDNTWSGIAVKDNNTKPILSANQCNNNGAWGIISWAGAEPLIENDNITLDNWRAGIMDRQ